MGLCIIPALMRILFAKLNRKLLGYYNYYGVTGNFQCLNSFVYQVKGLFFKWPKQVRHFNEMQLPKQKTKRTEQIHLIYIFGIEKSEVS